MVSVKDVSYRLTIGNHISFKAPLAAQLVHEQKFVGARWLAVDAVVRAHHGPGFAFGYGFTKRRQIGVHFVVLAYGHVGLMPRGLRAAVYRLVLGRSNGAVVARIVALHTGDKGNAQAPGQKGVFAVGFLAPAPARVTKNVAVARAHRLRVLDARLGADRDGHFMDSRRVKGCGQSNWLGKLRRSVHG